MLRLETQASNMVTSGRLQDAGRLFIHVLSSHQHGGVYDVLRALDKEVLQTTPGDCFVFSLDILAEAHVQSSCRDALKKGKSRFQRLGPEWSVPAHASNTSGWHLKEKYNG